MAARSSSIDPRLRALYLVAVAVGVFWLPGWELALAAAASQACLWLALGAGPGALWRQLRKLMLFLAVLLVAYALVGTGEAGDEWQRLALGGWELELSVTGALVGLTMVLRVIAVVLASQVARAGDPRALAAGLGRLGVPRAAALSIDATLALFGAEPGRGRRGGGGGGGGGGRGRGGGGGRGGGDGSGGGGGKSARGFVAGLRRLARGDTSLLADRLVAQIARAEAHIASADDEPDSRALARDVAVVTGVALTMLGIKALKLLPGLPFAPGHKGVLLIPLYIVAAALTRSRGGATLTGITMGTAAFVLGDGRWGIFEIAKHIAPGILVDLLFPLVHGGGRQRGPLTWSLFGMVVALGRFGTVTAIALTVQAPALVYAVLLPGLVVHAVFGALSGVVTARLLRAVETSAARRAKVGPEPPERGEENAG